jgi:hypothetical protein
LRQGSPTLADPPPVLALVAELRQALCDLVAAVAGVPVVDSASQVVDLVVELARNRRAGSALRTVARWLAAVVLEG